MTSLCRPFILGVVLLFVGTLSCTEPEGPRVSSPVSDTGDQGIQTAKPQNFRSSFFSRPVLVLPGVFTPVEAIRAVLPLMKENAELFRDKSVLEIGTGSGVVSLFAAELGAKKVVSTDINETAITNARMNAQSHGFSSIIEVRLVPLGDTTAYSVIGVDERFDVIISNPPYSLDLDASRNTAVTDTGDLGTSIVRGLSEHLNPGGIALLLYDSLFYHHVMMKFAQHEGYEVRDHSPSVMTPWEAETLFNSYLSRFLEKEGIDPGAFRFDKDKNENLHQIRIESERKPLFPGNSSRAYPGWMVIQRKERAL